MFVDIVQSSEILRKKDIEEADAMLTDILAPQIGICERHNGVVNQVMGDGIMCLFGVDDLSGYADLQAMRAAEEMLAAARALPVDIRIGIGSGEVLVKPAGHESFRAVYQVIGEAVHIADRALRHAPPGGILLNEASKKSLEKFYTFRQAATLPWRADRAPLAFYEKTEETPGLFHGKELAPPLRAGEAQSILDCFDRGTGGRAGLAWIHGAAGSGKSHLCQYVARHAGFEQRIDVAFLPHTSFHAKSLLLDEIWRRVKTGLQGREKPPRDLKDLCADYLGPDLAPHALEALSAGEGAPAFAALHSARRMLVTRFLQDLGAGKKILLVLEDLHWAGENDLAFLEALAALPERHFGILCTSRQPPHMGGFEVFGLAPLSFEKTKAFAKSLGEGFRLPGAVLDKLYALSQGNIYFIREYMAWIAQQKAEGKTAAAIMAMLESQTPDNLSGPVYARLQHMPADAVALVKLAAIQGMIVDLPLLRRMSGLAPGAFESHLAESARRHILHPLDENTWVFAHELLQIVVRNTIPRAAAEAFHRQALGLLRKSRGRPAMERICFHAQFTGDHLQGYAAARICARKAMRQSLPTAALYYLEKAEAALRKMFRHRALQRRTARRHVLRLDFMRLQNLFIANKYAAANKVINRLLKQRQLLVSCGLLQETLSFQGLYHWIAGNLEKAGNISSAILAADGATNYFSAIRENARLMNIRLDQGRYRDCIRHAEAILARLKPGDEAKKFALLVEAEAAARSCIALAHAKIGNPEETRLFAEAAAALAQESGDFFTKTYVFLYIAHAFMMISETGRAGLYLREARKFSGLAQSRLLMPYILSLQGLLEARKGRAAEGMKLCRDALALAQSTRLAIRVSLFQSWYAETLMRNGKYLQASSWLQKAIRNAKASGERGRMAYAAMLLHEARQRLNANTDDAPLLELASSFFREEQVQSYSRQVDIVKKYA